MTNFISLKITDQKLDLQACIDFVASDSCGAVATFIGTVRNKTKGQKVELLDFSTYKPMALKELEKIAQQALQKFEVHKIAIHHAEGALKIGDIPVVIAVSSAHRKASFEACEYAINTLKETVPIWKKEHFTNGEVWVNATP